MDKTGQIKTQARSPALKSGFSTEYSLHGGKKGPDLDMKQQNLVFTASAQGHDFQEDLSLLTVTI